METQSPFEELREIVVFSDKEIFTKIWTSPRKVFQYLEENDYDKFVTSLLALAGIYRGFDRAVSRNMGDDMGLIAIIAIAVIAGGLLGWLSYYIYSGLLKWTGSWLGGEAETSSILRVVAHGMIPSIVSLVFVVFQMLL
ncbi:MAG: YIP1 family protein, partial [Bacteroidetes bacterium]|nr:YIP1 family protein [Bacteroidota bacterium]